jgi:manganese/iron transport system permease protein
MSALLHIVMEPWSHAYFVKAALGGSIIAIACAVLGCYIVLRRMAFIGDAMSHALLPGVGIGYLVMNALVPGGFTSGGLLLGALIAAVLTSLSISALSQIDRVAEDTAIGIVYTGLFAFGVVILTRFQQYINIDLNHFFQGDIYGVSWEDMWLSAIVGVIVLGIIIVFYRYFTIVSFDTTMAASLGFPTRLIHTVLTGMIALVCVAGISMVGVIMIVGLLITPAALAYLFTDRLPRMMVIAACMGVLSVISGLYFSEWVNASGGGAIMFMGFLLFLGGLCIAPRYGLLAGWRRRRALVPQRDIEDCLKAGYEQQSSAQLEMGPDRTRKALRWLLRERLVDSVTVDGMVMLTEKGRHEAAHIERSHQLWEGHLVQKGMPPEQAHRAAEELEHLHDRSVLDQFDNELNHPDQDAHGVAIPGEREDNVDQDPELMLSLLREGDSGRVVSHRGEPIPGLAPSTLFRLGARDLKTEAWQVWLGDEMLMVSHEQADRLVVRFVDDADVTES